MRTSKKTNLVGINVGLILIMASQMLPGGSRLFGLALGIIATAISTRNYMRAAKATTKNATK